jgi:hypothetical protein
MELIDPSTRRDWLKLWEFGEWQIYWTDRVNKGGWCGLLVRRLDPRASRRSWWLRWSTTEQRVARSAYSIDLERRHPSLIPQLRCRLKDWRPG